MFDCCGLLPVPCPAVVPSTASIDSHHWQRDRRGCYIVNTSQQLLSSHSTAAVVPHMYAVGDCCAGPVAASKLAYTAELQAVVAAANVAQQLQGGVDAPLLSFPVSLSVVLPAPSLVCCSLGASDGVLVFNDVVVGGWLAALAKYVIERSKVGQYRGELLSVVLWAIGEPMTFALNRFYHAAIRAWRSVTPARHIEHST